jgi:hypothetical protein
MLALHRVKPGATDALERDVAALRLKTRMIAAVVINPQTEENSGDEEAVNDRGGDEVHGGGAKHRELIK